MPPESNWDDTALTTPYREPPRNLKLIESMGETFCTDGLVYGLCRWAENLSSFPAYGNSTRIWMMLECRQG